MRREFLVTGFNFLVRILYWLNVVEYAKLLSVHVRSKFLSRDLNPIEKRYAAGLGIDLYQVFKFFIIAYFIMCQFRSTWTEYVAYYLISSNAFTYFYYHAWGSHHSQGNELFDQRRRLLNFLLAIVFYILCYAYLYQMHFAGDIKWPNDQIDSINAIYLSVANSFTLTYGGFSPESQIARVLFMTQLINTFFFFTIMVSNSIPTIGNKE